MRVLSTHFYQDTTASQQQRFRGTVCVTRQHPAMRLATSSNAEIDKTLRTHSWLDVWTSPPAAMESVTNAGLYVTVYASNETDVRHATASIVNSLEDMREDEPSAEAA